MCCFLFYLIPFLHWSVPGLTCSHHSRMAWIWFSIIFLFVIIESKTIKKIDKLTCQSHMISIFQSMKCPSGSIGIGSDCQCDEKNCKIAYLHQYLPSLTLLNQYSWNSTQELCDYTLSQALTKNIHTRSNFVESHGYPLDIPGEICQEKEKLSQHSSRNYHSCSVSIGKFLRYNSLFEFNLFGRTARLEGNYRHAHPKDTLVDINYHNFPWRWAQNVKECEDLNLTSWNCAFTELSRPYHQSDTDKGAQHGKKEGEEEYFEIFDSNCHPHHSRQKKNKKMKRKQRSRELSPSLDSSSVSSSHCVVRYKTVQLHSSKQLIKQLRDIRVGDVNHINQFLLYGRILNMLSRPSDPVWNYLKKNLIFLSLPYENENKKTKKNRQEQDRQELLQFLSSQRDGQFSTQSKQKQVIAVSLHVRHGDSCDYMVQYELPKESRYLSPKSGQRPCYSLDVYLNKLSELREKYGVNRVYLATDSSDVIKRIQSEHLFEWVYIDLNREIFNGQGQKQVTGRGKWIDFYSNDYNSIITLSAVSDLFLMRFGQVFLGAFSSHFSKLSYYLMIGQRMTYLPFISLDYPLSCDTVDDCREIDIVRRDQSVVDIINHAPECVRDSDRTGGWMRGKRDPCGIYL